MTEQKLFSLPKGYRERLSAPMPPESIEQHPTKKYLSTIKSIYIIERLNSVFGLGGWDFEHEIIGQYPNSTFDGNGKPIKQVPFIVVKGRIHVKEFDIYTPYQYGGHEIDDKGTDPSDGFKSAVTDALSKCASYFEIGIQVFKGKPKSNEVNKDADNEINEKPKHEDSDMGEEANFAGMKRSAKTTAPKAEKRVEPAAKEETTAPKTKKDTPNPLVVAKNRIDEFIDAKSLAAEAKNILKEFIDSGGNEKDADTLKTYANNKYEKLKSFQR